jgi:predicted nucleic acid-binding protein
MSGGDAFFVDSNLLLYYVDPKQHSKQARAGEWLETLWAAGTGRLSWQVLHEFYWNAIKKMGLAPDSARGIVEDLSHWRPLDNSLGLVQQAWVWIDAAQLSYWDALIVSAAERLGARYLLSEDFQDERRYGDIQVLNPFSHAPSEFIR